MPSSEMRLFAHDTARKMAPLTGTALVTHGTKPLKVPRTPSCASVVRRQCMKLRYWRWALSLASACMRDLMSSSCEEQAGPPKQHTVTTAHRHGYARELGGRTGYTDAQNPRPAALPPTKLAHRVGFSPGGVSARRMYSKQPK